MLFATPVMAQQSYTTAFPLTENPIKEDVSGVHRWVNGGTCADSTLCVGLDWSNVQTTPAFAFGTQTGSGTTFDDSTAILTGSWGPNQTVSAQVFHSGPFAGEMEIRLHTTVSAHNITGYEALCNGGVFQLVRWEGPLGSFNVIGSNGTIGCSPNDILKATIVNNTNGSVTIQVFQNGISRLNVTDTGTFGPVFRTGNPGIGFFNDAGAPVTSNGEVSFTATDIAATAAGCTQAQVSAVINGPTYTAVDGDIIVIPACPSTSWASGITIAGKGITVVGTGTTNSTPGTRGAGTSTTTLSIAPNNSFFIFSGLAFGQFARVSNLNLNSSNPATVGGTGAFPLQFYGTCTASGCANVRVDNITFGTNNWTNNISGGGFVGVDNVFGVLDHNTANESAASGLGGVGNPFVQLAYSAWAGVGNFGDNSFAAADSFGTGNAMYVENNSFNFVRGTENDVATADGLQGGARYVCRFNTVVNMSGTGLCSAHGSGWLGRLRGQRQIEVYYNTVTPSAANGCDGVTGIASGTGYFLSNTLVTTAIGCNEFVRVDIARFIQNTPPWNNCDGTQPWDQTPFTSSSICFDHPGHGGLGALLQASTPVLASAPGTPCTTAGQCYPNAPLAPIYEAGDTSTVANVSQGINGISGGTHLVQNRDYYGEVSQAAQSNTTTPFNGTTGTGYGAFARRPTTCTTGVAYWATDQGTWNNGGTGGILYKCTSTNIWGTLYTPYTYPHPLISASVSASPVTPTVSLSPAILLTFGNQSVNAPSSPARTVTLTNTGGATLNITSILLTGGNAADFSITNDTCNIGGTLAPSSSCVVSLAFTPSVLGTRTTTLQFTTNASSSPDNVSLSGVGVFITAPAVQMSFLGRTGNISGAYTVKP